MKSRDDLKEQVKRRGGELAQACIAGRDQKPDSGDFVFVLCPFHDDHSPDNCHVNIAEGWFKCHACEAKGDALTLLAGIMGKDPARDFPAILDHAAELLGIRVERNGSAPKTPAKLANPLNKEAFAARYGLTPQDFKDAAFTFAKFTGFPDYFGQDLMSVCYPVHYLDGQTAQKFKSVGRDQKDHRLQHVHKSIKGQMGLIQPCELPPGVVLVLAGGEEKALAAIKAGFHAVALQSGEKAPSPEQMTMLQRLAPAEIIIAYDADEPGRIGALAAAQVIDAAGIPVRRVVWPPSAKAKEDLNDVLAREGPEAVARLLEAATPYGEAIPTFDRPPELPAFPVECIPLGLRQYVAHLTETIQVPVDTAALAVLAAVSTAIAGRAQVDVRPEVGWRETVNVFLACAMNTAERKSPVVAHIMRPLLAYQKEVRKKHKEASAESKAKIKALEKTLALSAKAAGQSQPGAVEKMTEIEAELEKLREAVKEPPTLILQNVTPESLERDLEANGGAGSIISGEPDLLENFLGRYSNGKANLSLLLQAYSGEYFQSSRITRASVVIEHPTLTFFVTPQPSFLMEMATKSLNDRGLFGRFIWAMPDPRAGSRDHWPDPTDPDSEKDFNRILGLLCRTPEREGDMPWLLRFSDDARAEFKEFCRMMEPRLKPESGDLACIGSWSGKATGRLARIASLLHAAKRFGGEWYRAAIDGDTMRDAIRIMNEWAIPHALAAHRMMGLASAGPKADALKVWDWLKKFKGKTVNGTDFRKGIDHFGLSKESMEKALDELEGQRFIQMVEERTGGRPKRLIRVGPFVEKVEQGGGI